MDFVIRGGVLEKYNGASTEVVIPNGVIEIGQVAFAGCAGIRSVVIPNGVTRIGRPSKEIEIFNSSFYGPEYSTEEDDLNGAFAGCRNLVSITIPNSVIDIGERAFFNCSNLKKVTMSSSLKTIGNMAFAGCGSLTFLSLPDGLVKIGVSAFKSAGITSIFLPNSIETIGFHAFESTKITHINIPRNLEYISGFDGCDSLSVVDIPRSNHRVIYNRAFLGSGITSFVVPDTVISIGVEAFSYCLNLQSVTIPKSVERIGRDAFCHAGIVTLNLMGEPTLECDDDGMFKTCKNLEVVNADRNWIRKNSFHFSIPFQKSHKELFEEQTKGSQGACYIATAVYGSYDCPQVWTLRRYRDYYLAESMFGRLFIHFYYAISPTIVSWFKDKDWFQRFWKNKLDKKVYILNQKGYMNTPYSD